MIKINSIILFLVLFYIIKKLSKTNDKNDDNNEKYNYNLKKIPDLKNNSYKNIYDELDHAEFKKEETKNLEKS